MRWVLILTVLAPAAGAQPASLGIYLDFDHEPAADSIQAMKNEVSEILKPAGYVVNWRRLNENKGQESFSDLLVVRFIGKCGSEPLAGSDFGSLGETVALGATRVSEGHVLPFSEVQCDQVRKTLPYVESGDRHAALGKALGRVIAHELYHMLAHTTGHAAHGLNRATQSWRDLVSGTLTFGAQDLKAIRGTGAGSRDSGSGATAGLSLKSARPRSQIPVPSF